MRSAHVFLAISALCGLAVQSSVSAQEPTRAPAARGCPADMVRVHDFCVDRYEMSTVADKTGQPLSPYYPPHPRLLREVHWAWKLERSFFGDNAARRMPLPEIPRWQQAESFAARAVSRAGAVPQAYLSYPLAKSACARAGKRLCTHQEWATACRGARQTKFPYGNQLEKQKCNVWGHVHPAYVLHGNSSIGHRDPRLNLLALGGDEPLLRRTGSTKTCASRWAQDAIYDMVGNLDEWVDDENGRFVGGFYARSTTKGCESQIANHSPIYYDYSTGARCCKGV